MILLFMIALFLSCLSLFMVIKFLIKTENRWHYFNSFTSDDHYSFLRRMLDNLNYITFLSLLLWGHWYTSLTFMIIILVITLAACLFNKIPVYVAKLLLFYASMVFKPLYKFRNITNVESFFIIANPTVNVASFLITAFLWIGVII